MTKVALFSDKIKRNKPGLNYIEIILHVFPIRDGIPVMLASQAEPLPDHT
jgi:uncharacterized protein YbaR (Trm112 family)